MDNTGKHWYWLGAMAILGLAAAYAVKRDFYGQYIQYRGSEADVVRMDQQLRDLEAAESELAATVRELAEDSIELEAAVRREKGRVRDGEKVYRVELPGERSN